VKEKGVEAEIVWKGKGTEDCPKNPEAKKVRVELGARRKACQIEVKQEGSQPWGGGGGRGGKRIFGGLLWGNLAASFCKK